MLLIGKNLKIFKEPFGASVPCIDIPTDLAISSVLYKAAAKEKVKYILSGVIHNRRNCT